ncbi:Peptidoglycan/LPS O-acetylase OafA/YrhL, contains acyltransferase and SGNH-hydrolase domains [Sphingomonas laterariae]|uniref:Peptidoglycan/LPS O-acetylase OafA/YrhL, contains acyltransferase and SGNH-hydrolase domains n=1 Tax=Edaphosphingomonas laterariae TaxID=861865 RepID=A0A239FS24_9SPHN|nr:acyltransferase [Sphingomonas laterariae]SNS59585.1 Peptidoglycan/LPS O-acetylase OafA/YrhL, contains acyltransferase and SGNH-hydrolase domains [Sphingomonas laterariae]
MSGLLIPAEAGAMRRNNFDAIRLGMALLVIWSHCFAIYHGSEANEPVSRLLGGHYNAGNVGVWVFFIISGFLISHSYVRSPDLWTYLKRRVARIHPGFIAATSICAFLVVPLFSSQGFAVLSPAEVARTIGLNILLQGHMPPSDAFAANPVQAVNGALWSIPFEFWCYLGLAALGAAGAMRKRIAVPLLMVLIMLVRAWLDLTGRKPGGGIIGDIIGWPYLWFAVAPCFLAGMSVYLYRDRLPRSRTLFAGLLLALLIAAHLPVSPLASQILCGLLFPPATAYMVFHLGFSRSVRLPDVARRGDYSYGTYLYGFPIQQMVMAAFGVAMPFFLYVPTVLALSLIAGMASWYCVEQWFLPRSRREHGERQETSQGFEQPAAESR